MRPTTGRDLDFDRERARHDRVHSLAHDVARRLDRVHDRFRVRHLDHDRALDADYIRRFDCAVDLARSLARVLVSDLDLGDYGDHDHARDLARARDVAQVLDVVRADARVYAEESARDFDRVWTRTTELVNVLERLMPAATQESGKAPAARPARAAQGLAQAAARVLPAAHRCRYREEFHCELHELAAAKTPRWRQLLYAVRLLDRAWVLRAELRAPAAEQARP
jgi:hypothetical protein